MISVSEARNIVEANTERLTPVRLPLPLASGSVLAEDVHSPLDIPAFAQSSMDGYAFAFDGLEGDGRLSIAGVVAAGTQTPLRLERGQAARIFTGAPLPEGADTVAMQEKCSREGDILRILHRHSKGENVRPPGSEAKRGALAMEAGSLLSPASVGFLSGLGLTDVMVHPRPSVSLIVTGDELQEPGETLRFGQVYESNSRMLEAALFQSGVERIEKMRCPDDIDALTERLSTALEVSDLVLLTGGVSVGDFDHVAKAAGACGVKTLFHRVRQKPGKPLFFGRKGGKPVFGLPGNPASVLTCFYEYVCLSIDAMCARKASIGTLDAPLRKGVRKPPGLTWFMKAFHDGESVEVLDGQESYRLSSFAKSNCLVVLGEDVTDFEAGEQVEIHLLPV